MKKLILAFFFLVPSISILAQEQTVNKDKAYYQQKSKSQKSTAFALLIGGGVAVGVGFLVGDRQESSFDQAATGAIVAGIGVLGMIGSIPLFIAAGKNKRKANLIVKSVPLPLNPYSVSNNRQVQVGISINL